jgi:hypothetical protein
VKVRINDAGNVFFYTAREQEAELLLKAGLAEPEAKGKKIRRLRLTVGRGQAWAFLRGGRSIGQSSKTFKVERVGDKRLPIFQHQFERCLEFRPEVKVTTSGPREPEVMNALGPMVKSEPVETCEQLPAVDSSCAQPEIEIAVNPEREEVAEREPERVPVEPETPYVAVPAKQPEHIREYYSESITSPVTILEPEPYDISSERSLARAVLLRAFEDSQTDLQARRWFEASQGMLDFWCQAAGLDVGRVRKRAQKICPDAATL